jgi:23S rRNA (pseudouridine1915-N3)-methyltransferase
VGRGHRRGRRDPGLSRLQLVAVGRIGNGPEAALFARYAARLRPTLAVTEVPDGRGSAAEITRREASSILGVLVDANLVVVLDLDGEALDSSTLAARLTRWRESGRDICFVIGGAEGLHASVLSRANVALSLGRLTWPHLLARTMLAEQLFRAQSIARGHPYHRAGRP